MAVGSALHVMSRFVVTSLAVPCLLFAITIPTAVAAQGTISSSAAVKKVTVTAKYLTAPQQKVTTSTGKKLSMGVNAAWEEGSATATVTLDLLKHVSTALPEYEGHTWTFTVARSSFTDPAGAANLIVTSKQIGWYGQLQLAFNPTGHVAQKCRSGSGTIYNGTITGAFHFNTNQNSNAGWGSIVSGKVDWPKSSLTVEFSCFPNVPTPTSTCSEGVVWSSPSVILGVEESKGFEGSSLHYVGSKGSAGFISAVRTVNSKINGTTVMRSDSDMDLSPAPTWNASKGSVTILTGSPGGTLIAGKAQLTLHLATPPRTYPGTTCMEAGKARPQCYTSYSAFSPPNTSSWVNGTPPLAAHMSIGGNITESNISGSASKAGSVTVYSVGCTTKSVAEAGGDVGSMPRPVHIRGLTPLS